ncbi:MAG: hypothetical protein K9N06_01350 [Candidatus Cloacimonetes bacterium]|nr:hypothetical protein [Candidatus Cloacimonadota bacterium]
MWWDVFRFEFKFRFQNISTYIYIVIFFLLGVLLTNIMGGAISGTRVMMSSEKVLLNSPFLIMLLVTMFGLLGLFITASMMGFSIYRDFEYNIYPLFFTKPVSKFAYLLGRYLANALIVTFILVGIGAGMLLGQFCPWLNKELFGAIHLSYYLWPYVVNILPNVLFTGAIFFSLAFATRRMLPVYIGAIVLFVGYFIGLALFESLDTKGLAALLDPMGMNAIGEATEHFSVVERNTRLVPFSGYLLWNRVLWLSVGAILMLITYLRFQFSQTLVKSGKVKKSSEPVFESRKLPQVTQRFGWAQEWKQFISLVKLEFREIIGSAGFITIVFAGIILLVVSVFQSGKMYETEVLPLTYNVLAVVNGNFRLMSLIILLVFAGETLWKAREHKLDGILESLPVPEWVTMFSKFSALLLVQLILLILASSMGLLYQAGKGFTALNFSLYAANIGLSLADAALLATLVFVAHIMANNKFTGHGLAIGLYILFQYIGLLGLEHPLFHYGKGGGWVYSDMNGFGTMLEKWGVFRIYWGFLAVLLLTAGLLFYPRGNDRVFKKRWLIARQRLNQPMLFLIILLAVGFIGMGSYIYYNENVLNDFKRNKTSEKERAYLEKKYKHYDGIAQPRYTDVYVQADIFPEASIAEIHGIMQAENKTDSAIDSLIVVLNTDIDYEYFDFNRAYRANVKDADFGFYTYKFLEPLQPGEKIEIEYNCTIARKGYNSITSVVHNGTFFNSMEFFPHLGYSDGYELLSEEKRKKYNLPEKPRMALVDDENARMNNYISDDADWVNYEAVVSTAAEQTAITPGYLESEWVVDGRRYFHYIMDHPVLNFFCYVSAKYEEKHEIWTGKHGEEVELTVYYDSLHPYNIERMLVALQKGLDYYTANLGEYPDRQVRILEFPRYSAYAQSFANTIPYSESVGFVADVKDGAENIDYPFWVTAHELAHQWWAHQVIGANVQGCVLMSEALAQYSSLMVMEKKYGKMMIGNFLKHELSSYLMGRGGESIKEQPLYLVENQQYIHYNKGAIVMYALQDYCGEKAVNKALADYIKATAWQQPPYTNSMEFMEYMTPIVPDSLNYILDDWFRRITLYNNKIIKAESNQLDTRKYEVKLEVETAKFYADGLGEETEAEMNDYVEIVIFGNAYVNGEQKEKPIYRHKHRLTGGKHEITIFTRTRPTRAGIDGLYKLIDKNLWDNVIKVNDKSEAIGSETEGGGITIGAEISN